MSDSDEDDNFELYGTPLEPLDEETIPKKRAFTIEDQVATDEQGRRRFHGAFTGGFSAGFFNTVGSLEGWKPSEFKSSRSEKADKKLQKPEDFMDQEDLGEFGIAPKRLKATNDYSQAANKRKRVKQFEGPIPGEPILYSLLEPARDTVGVKLLKKMGWKPGQGVGPRISKKEKRKMKVYGCQMPNNRPNSESGSDSDDDIKFAPDDYDPFFHKPKNDIFGLGYVGLAPKVAIQQISSEFRVMERNNKKFSISGQAFGVGAFENEDDDIYSKDDLSNYDFALEGPKQSKKSPVKKDFYHSTILEGFAPQKTKGIVKKVYPPPEIPKGFIPKHGARISRFEPLPESHSLFNYDRKEKMGRHDLTPADRSKILSHNIILEGQRAPPTPKDTFTNQSAGIKGQGEGLKSQGEDSEGQKGEGEGSKGQGEALRSQGEVLRSQSSGSKGQKGSNSDWRSKLMQNMFKSGETLNKDETPTKMSSEEAERKALQEKALKITENLPKINTGNFKPFLADQEKQTRYEAYLTLLKQNKQDQLSDLQPVSMSDWERERERSEFEQASRLFKPTTGLVFDKFVSSSNPNDDLDPLKSVTRSVFDHGTIEMREAAEKNMFGPLTRVTLPWTPHKLLCRRFNVPEPKVGDELVVPAKKRNRFNIFDYYEAYQQNKTTDTQQQKTVEHRPRSSTVDLLQDKTKDNLKTNDTKRSDCQNEKVEGNLKNGEEQIANSRKDERKSEEILKEGNKTIEESLKNVDKLKENCDKHEERVEENLKSNEDKVEVTLNKNEENVVNLKKDEKKLKIDEAKNKENSRIEDKAEGTSNKQVVHLKKDEDLIKNEELERKNLIEEEVIEVPKDPKAKKDLFKAIFLSSSESESESENEDKEEEKLEEMKKIVEQSLLQKSTTTSKQNEENKSTSSSNIKRGFFSDLDLSKLQKPKEANTEAKQSPISNEATSVYGPTLPSTSTSTSSKKNISNDEEWRPVFTRPTTNVNEESSKSEEWRPVFNKEKIVKKTNEDILKVIQEVSSSDSDEWVEKEKSDRKKKKCKKEKKQNKKHKTEKSKKHKSKHKKRKRKDDSD